MSKKEINFDDLQNVFGGTYHRYTTSGQTLWAVYNETNGDWDPGYFTLEKAIAADQKYNKRAIMGRDLGNIYLY